MKQILKRGLIAIAPLTLTIAILVWVFNFLEHTFGKLLITIVGPTFYFPGMGLLIAIVILFIFGTILNTWIIEKLWTKGEELIQKIPLVKSLYSAISDAMNFLSTPKSKDSQKVVKVCFGEIELVGIVTREDFEDLGNLSSKDNVCVFFSLSYQIGGITAIVPKSKIVPINLTVEKAMKFLITAGAKASSKST